MSDIVRKPTGRHVMIVLENDNVVLTTLLPTVDRDITEFRRFFRGWLKDMNEIYGELSWEVKPPTREEISKATINELIEWANDQDFSLDVIISPIDRVARPVKG